MLKTFTVDIELPCSVQMAWSKDSKRILVIGNGWNSSLVVYDVSMSKEGSKQTLSLAWTLLADEDSQHLTATENETGGEQEAGSNVTKKEVDVELSGKNYRYVVAYFMAEFNPTGNVFAVMEIPYKTAFVQLLSADGKLVKTQDLMLAMGEAECARRPVQTLFISEFHDGVYAIGVEGGKVALVDAEALDVKKTFSVVSS